ncbi:MAG: LCP family protein [Pseudanabaenaceae cyanobacterium SKYGB_i_bin29]|nr:LCP family protein [Pseudanabaenaceae cyanobacterium SKYG29]MDW8420525.1 LCP family protein [Pseudanabaenaceae cyanobacterium SKYGB_i_bin29]
MVTDSRTKLAPKLLRRPHRWGNIFLLGAMGIAISLGALTAKYVPVTAIDWQGLLQGRNVKEVWLEALGKNLTTTYQVLILGVDRGVGQSGAKFSGRTDTIMLIRFDPQGKITLLSIPRDTQVQIEGVGTAKINAANVYGGVEAVQTTLQELLPQVRIDRYVRIDTGGLRAVIDAIGGVEIDVPERMYYEDKTQGLLIDLQPGKQTLNGKEAEAFSRFRGDTNADIGRIQRQQMLLQSVQKKLGQPWTILRLKSLIETMKDHIDTNLTAEEMIALSAFSLSLPPSQITTLTLPGQPLLENDVSYWQPDLDTIDATIVPQFLRE